MKSFKHYELELLKVGKVSRTLGLNDIGTLAIEEVFSTIKRRGLLLFFPEHKRKKMTIGRGKDFGS